MESRVIIRCNRLVQTTNIKYVRVVTSSNNDKAENILMPKHITFTYIYVLQNKVQLKIFKLSNYTGPFFSFKLRRGSTAYFMKSIPL